jgi:predicted nuclease of restriction endonuclease-like RecB superfamily
MISKEFLTYRETSEGVKPSFISDRGVWLERCSELLNQLQACVGKTQQDCDELFKEWINKGEGGVLVRKGLAQTLQKKLEWQELEYESWEKHRHQQLAASATLWTGAEEPDRLSQQLNDSRNASKTLYGDLPHCRKLISLPKWDAEKWIRRYNLALIQGFVLQSKMMDWEFSEISLDKLRYLMRYLKFFGLFFRVKQQGNGTVKMRIEGPLELFAGLKRYQMKMAAAVGVLPQLGSFQVKVQLDLPKTTRPLIWSDRDHLKSHYRPFFEYCSDERRQFEEKLRIYLAKSKAQLVNPKVSMSALLNENIPDYCMVNTLGQQLDLHIYEQHQLSMLKYWTDPPKTDVQRVFMLEKGLEAHFVAPEHAEVIVFNKIPVFSAFKKICQSLAFI